MCVIREKDTFIASQQDLVSKNSIITVESRLLLFGIALATKLRIFSFTTKCGQRLVFIIENRENMFDTAVPCGGSTRNI